MKENFISSFISYFIISLKQTKKKWPAISTLVLKMYFWGGFYSVVDQLQSRTRDCKQIHEIKQNRFLYGMQLVFCEFLTKASKFGFWVSARYSSSNSSTPRTFLKFPKIIKFGNSQLLHSLSGDNNLVPFHLWWKEIVLRM